MTLTYGSLFTGIGGMDLGLDRAGLECRWQVEIDEYARKVLAKHWPNVRRHDDVRTFPPEEGGWHVEVIAGGFPCQQVSSSGNKTGLAGEQSGLWREYARVVRLLRPRYVVVENVSDLLIRGMGDVLGDLASIGYDAEWECLPAAAFGLPQRRWRTFIVAHLDGFGREGGAERDRQGAYPERWAHDDGLALAQRRAGDARSWVRRAPHGTARRVDRLRAIGNAVVPQLAEWIGRRLIEFHELRSPR